MESHPPKVLPALTKPSLHDFDKWIEDLAHSEQLRRSPQPRPPRYTPAPSLPRTARTIVPVHAVLIIQHLRCRCGQTYDAPASCITIQMSDNTYLPVLDKDQLYARFPDVPRITRHGHYIIPHCAACWDGEEA